jgi:hypothetical protein
MSPIPVTPDLLQSFLESWGLSFDTPDGDSSNIPYPAVYQRMRDDATQVYGEHFSKFLGRITDTTDSETYLTPISWDEVKMAWEDYNQENP